MVRPSQENVHNKERVVRVDFESLSKTESNTPHQPCTESIAKCKRLVTSLSVLVDRLGLTALMLCCDCDCAVLLLCVCVWQCNECMYVYCCLLVHVFLHESFFLGEVWQNIKKWSLQCPLACWLLRCGAGMLLNGKISNRQMSLTGTC
jgi:hypothetical protein